MSLPSIDRGRDAFYNGFKHSKNELVLQLDRFKESSNYLLSVKAGLYTYSFKRRVFEYDIFGTCYGNKTLQDTIFRTHLVYLINDIAKRLASNGIGKAGDESDLKEYLLAKCLKNTNHRDQQEFLDYATIEQCEVIFKKLEKVTKKIQSDAFLSGEEKAEKLQKKLAQITSSPKSPNRKRWFWQK